MCLGENTRKRPHNDNQLASVSRRTSVIGPSWKDRLRVLNQSLKDDLTERRSSYYPLLGRSVSARSPVSSSAACPCEYDSDEDKGKLEDLVTPWTCTLVLS